MSPVRDPARLRGIDAARGLAVVGMMAAHVALPRTLDLGDPASWLAVTDGRSSILFATLAGVSIALMSGRERPASGDDLARVRLRILVRAACLFLLGGLLASLQTYVAVILEVYAVLFVAVLPLLRWRASRLLALAGAGAVALPVLTTALTIHFDGSLMRPDPFVLLVVTGHYPALTWVAFAVAGLGIGRLALGSTRVQLLLVTVGAGLAVLAYGGSALLEAAVPAPPPGWEYILSTTPHEGSPFEVVGSGGTAIAVIGLCLRVAALLPAVLVPLEAVGQLALTVYAVHIVVIDLLAPEGDLIADDGAYLAFVAVTVVLCLLWTRTLGRGPLERALGAVAGRTSGAGARGRHDREPAAEPVP
ncbi:heparan-alpha-glucosaminide N-acetyltransferase domain-containing protein [Clavibacter sp. MX14-G9D]|uniref:heparan-alpha-glucosaminide N-acetyltransferase domain-containing protein n=1 Tax=Clavibacter sp. MX14-G9D TaxID=3064656 RepID=UPI00293F00AC|nr:heparan-alpha-glucosaminide N-acetyltransferase domain-containing protein [Clavibacter sp. MX14-G9D]